MKQNYVNTRRNMAGISILLLCFGMFGIPFVHRVEAGTVLQSTASGMYDHYEGVINLDSIAPVPTVGAVTVKVKVPAVAVEDPGNISTTLRLALDTSAGIYEAINSYYVVINGTEQLMDLTFVFGPGAQLLGDGLDFIYPFTDAPGAFDIQIQGSATDVFAGGSWAGEALNGAMLDTYFVIDDTAPALQNTVQTDVTLGASGPEIRIWGQVDSYTQCSNLPQANSPGIIPLISIPGIADVGHTDRLDGNYIPWGTYFDITFTTENLYNTGQLPYSLETGITGDQDVWQVSTMQVNPTGTDWSTECDYLLGDWSGTVFTLTQPPAPAPFSSVEVGEIIDYTCPAGSAGGNWFLWNDDGGAGASGEGEWLCDDKSAVFVDGAVVIQETPTTFSVNTPGTYTIEAYDASGNLTLQSFSFDVVPASGGGGGGGTFTPLTFSLLPTTTEPTDLIASVAGGVQTTGKAIWPMFAFVGISLAFIIALQTVVFIKRSTYPEKRGTGDPNAPKRKPRRNSRGQFIKFDE